VAPCIIAAILISIALFFILRGGGAPHGGRIGDEAPLPADAPEAVPAAEDAAAEGQAAPQANDAAEPQAPEPAGSVAGTVRVRGTGDPAPGMSIVARPEVPGRKENPEIALRMQEGDRSAESDSAGRYRIRGLADGGYRIFALRGETDFVGIPPAHGLVVRIGPERNERVDLEVTLGGAIYGRIVDPAEKPLAGA